MPVYEYACKSCDREFELVESMAEHDDASARCPHCKSEDVERRWSSVFAQTSKKS